jgi:hypothetical protein
MFLFLVIITPASSYGRETKRQGRETKRQASHDSPAATGRRELPSVTRSLSQGFDRSNQVDVTALASEPEPGNDDRALQEFTAIRQRDAFAFRRPIAFYRTRALGSEQGKVGAELHTRYDGEAAADSSGQASAPEGSVVQWRANANR